MGKNLLRQVNIIQSSARLPKFPNAYCLLIPFINLGFSLFSTAVSVVCYFKAMTAEKSKMRQHEWVCRSDNQLWKSPLCTFIRFVCSIKISLWCGNLWKQHPNHCKKKRKEKIMLEPEVKRSWTEQAKNFWMKVEKRVREVKREKMVAFRFWQKLDVLLLPHL